MTERIDVAMQIGRNIANCMRSFLKLLPALRYHAWGAFRVIFWNDSR